MNLSDEVKQLHALHLSGVLTDDEFAQAKARVLTGGSANSALDEALSRIQSENALTRLDLDWQVEREKYMTARKNGQRVVGSVEDEQGLMIFSTLAMGVLTVVAIVMGFLGTGWFALWFVVCFIAIAINLISESNRRIDTIRKYEIALRDYETKRAELVSKQTTSVDS